ncbi:hypothetical protein CDAR_413521 [Caerostris darwini]|uniref:Uncharacterized protein n=1 Tax=Caerostris darwini TaxID=1538125 RepID=A0AAV4SRN6_9ARAC|nr:hypothetical protein CDAR_413521 [Caerostris darwini]
MSEGGGLEEPVARQNCSLVLLVDILFSKCPVQCPALRTESIIQGEPFMAREIWRPIKEFSASNSLVLFLAFRSLGRRPNGGLILPCQGDERRGGSGTSCSFVLLGDILFSKCPVQCPTLRTESIIQGEPFIERKRVEKIGKKKSQEWTVLRFIWVGKVLERDSDL